MFGPLARSLAEMAAPANRPKLWFGVWSGFAIAIVYSAVHLLFKVPVPELVLQDKEWRRVRWGAFVLFGLNYAWVIYAYAVLGLR